MHSHADWPPRATAAVLPSTVPRAASFRVDPVLARTPDARANLSGWSAQSNHPSADAYRASSDDLEDASDDDDSDDWSEAVGEKLVQRLERSAERSGCLVPTRPIPTLAKTVTFTNRVAMEIGCQYGEVYWR